MIKTVALIVRRPDVSRDEFRAHYEEVHAPLALPLMPELERYCRNHIVNVIHGEPTFDVLSAFEYESLEAAGQMFARIQSPAGDAIRADELTFMDPPRNVFFLAAPDVRIAGPEGEEHYMVMVRAPQEDREAWLAEHDAAAVPALFAAMSDVGFAAEHQTAPAGPDDPPWDRMTQLRASGAPSLKSWIAERESRGGVVLALQTRCHETSGLRSS